jgi:hypothetical protein
VDTKTNLSWIAMGYDPVSENYPLTQHFPDALSVGIRMIAEDCHRNLQQLTTLRVIQESRTAKQALPMRTLAGISFAYLALFDYCPQPYHAPTLFARWCAC